MKKLTVRYPLARRVRRPSPSKAEIAELRDSVPTEYKPTVAIKSMSPGDTANTGAGSSTGTSSTTSRARTRTSSA